MDNSIIGIGIALGVSFFILYTRKKKWMNPKVIWVICCGLLSVGIIGILNTKAESKDDLLMFFGFCVPTIYWCFDRTFKSISLRIQKRDFILYLRHSDEINSKLFGENPHVKIWDKLFSLGLLIIIIMSMFIGMNIINN